MKYPALLALSLIGTGCNKDVVVNNQPNVNIKHVCDKPVSDKSAALRDFWAICLFEGRGVINENAVNHRENARGAAQITPAYLQDANDWLETHNMRTYTHEEMHDSSKAFLVCQAYWRRYQLRTSEDRARSHCAGPDGPTQACSLNYWHGVQSYL